MMDGAVSLQVVVASVAWCSPYFALQMLACTRIRLHRCLRVGRLVGNDGKKDTQTDFIGTSTAVGFFSPHWIGNNVNQVGFW